MKNILYTIILSFLFSSVCLAESNVYKEYLKISSAFSEQAGMYINNCYSLNYFKENYCPLFLVEKNSKCLSNILSLIPEADTFNQELKKEVKKGTNKYTFVKKTSQELRMLSRSLSDCKSLAHNVMIEVSQFVCSSQLCH